MAAWHWTALGLSPIAFHVGPWPIRWYALSYMAMILLGWWYLTVLVRRPGAPLSRAQVDGCRATRASCTRRCWKVG